MTAAVVVVLLLLPHGCAAAGSVAAGPDDGIVPKFKLDENILSPLLRSLLDGLSVPWSSPSTHGATSPARR
jgi:hypothetical protein